MQHASLAAQADDAVSAYLYRRGTSYIFHIGFHVCYFMLSTAWLMENYVYTAMIEVCVWIISYTDNKM